MQVFNNYFLKIKIPQRIPQQKCLNHECCTRVQCATFYDRKSYSRVSLIAASATREQDIKYIRIYRLGRESAILSCYVLFFGFNSFNNNTPSRAVWVDKAILFFILRSLEARTALNSKEKIKVEAKRIWKKLLFFLEWPQPARVMRKVAVGIFSFHYKIVVTARSGSAIVSCFQSLAVNSRILWPRLDGARLDHKVCWSYKEFLVPLPLLVCSTDKNLSATWHGNGKELGNRETEKWPKQKENSFVLIFIFRDLQRLLL